jgi:DNA-binding beta-propeller fold protein YncE
MERSSSFPIRPARRAARAAVFAAALAAAALSSACAGAQKPTEKYVWPYPPEKPRIEFVRAFSGTDDFDDSGTRNLWRNIYGGRRYGVFNPTGLALSPDEKRLYVTCAPVGRVTVFDLESGKVAPAANAEGKEPRMPLGVALDAEGNLYVGDQAERLIWVYGPDGKFLRQIGKGQFNRPVGLAIDRKRQILYAVDVGNGESDPHRVQAFSLDGRLLRSIGSRGADPGQFQFPSYVAVAPDGRVYVADTLNFRVQVFDPEGAIVTAFGGIGEQSIGQFARVKGIAFDSFGNVYVADGQTSIVEMFSPVHQPLMFFGGPGQLPALMQLPNAIAIDSKNNIFVADYWFNQVKQYRLVNTTAEDSRVGGPSASSKPAAKPDEAKPNETAAKQ